MKKTVINTTFTKPVSRKISKKQSLIITPHSSKPFLSNSSSKTSIIDVIYEETQNITDALIATTPGVVFRYINGNRFHKVKPPRYHLPNDQFEADALQVQHHVYRYQFQSNFSAPVADRLEAGGIKVLDVGCATGSWLLDMARTFPRASFYGLDILPLLTLNNKIPNIIFVQANILDGLPFNDNYFDFVFMRGMTMTFSERDWREKVIPDLVRVTKPSGYLEIMEEDMKCHNQGPILKAWNEAFLEDLRSRDIDGSICDSLPHFLSSNSQLHNVRYEIKPNPIGFWGGRCGELAAERTTLFMRILEQKWCSAINVTLPEYKQMISRVEKEFNEYQTIAYTHRCFAQKM